MGSHAVHSSDRAACSRRERRISLIPLQKVLECDGSWPLVAASDRQTYTDSCVHSMEHHDQPRASVLSAVENLPFRTILCRVCPRPRRMRSEFRIAPVAKAHIHGRTSLPLTVHSGTVLCTSLVTVLPKATKVFCRPARTLFLDRLRYVCYVLRATGLACAGRSSVRLFVLLTA